MASKAEEEGDMSSLMKKLQVNLSADRQNLLNPKVTLDLIRKCMEPGPVMMGQAHYIKENLKNATPDGEFFVQRTASTGHHSLQQPPLPFDDLRPENRVELSDLALATNQVLVGKYLLCQTLSPASKVVAIEFVVGDPKGEQAVRLALYNYSLVEKSLLEVDFDEIIPPGFFLVLQNPWFKSTATGGLMLRSDNPAEVELVSMKRMIAKFPNLKWYGPFGLIKMFAFELFGKQHFWNNLDGDEAAFAKLKWLGNKGFVDKRFTDAIRFYNLCLDYCEKKSEQEAMILSNKSAALLALGCFNTALNCAEAALEIDPENVKAIYRKSKALLGNQEYEKAFAFLHGKFQKNPSLSENKDCNTLSDSILSLWSRKTHGPTSSQLTSLQLNTCTDFDKIPEYVGPITVSPIKGKGRGVIATEDIHPGQLLICAKAFGYHESPSVRRSPRSLYTSFNFGNNSIQLKSCHEQVVGKIANKLHFDPAFGPAFYKLTGGNDISSLKAGDDNVGHVDMKRIDGIVKINAFGTKETSVTDAKDFTGCWLLPSFFNHSCSEFNCIWDISGEFMIVRAVAEVKKGDELIVPYIRPNASYKDRLGVFKSHEFTCTCKLCQLDAKDPLSVTSERKKILQSLGQLNIKTGPGEIKRALKQVEKLHSLRKDKPELNFSLLSKEVFDLSAILYQKGRPEESISVLNRMFDVANNSCLRYDNGIKIALNFVGCYLTLRDKKMVTKWLTTTKKLTVKFYKSLEPMQQIGPNTIEMLKTTFDIDFFQD